MNTRQEQLLNLVIENHIQTAEPVGSKFLAAEKLVDCGEATVRNELRALEEEGFLSHPHTSAGRMPTVAGYKFYLNKIDWNKIKLESKNNQVLDLFLEKNVDSKERLKNIAKAVAEISNQTILIAFSYDSLYYTGLSNLFRHKEIAELNLAADVSAMFDRCEECLEKFYDSVEDNINFFLSDEHPFGSLLSVGAFRFGGDGLFAMLGPIRMDYKKNFAILNKIKEII